MKYALGFMPFYLSILLPIVLLTGGLGTRIPVVGLIGILVLWVLNLWLLFRETLDLVQGVGPIYWITRSTQDKRVTLRKCSMRETDHPWRTGVGLQVSVPYRAFQIGTCRSYRHLSINEGLLHTVLGRNLTNEPHDIGGWNGTEGVEEK